PSDLTYVKLDINFNPGSGKPDLFVDIPTAVFGSDTSKFVYLYSKFGVQDLNDQILGGTKDAGNGGSANDGYEEWARGIGAPIQASGSITTTVFQRGAPAQSPVALGSVVHDTSLITFTSGGPTPTGTVTYDFYSNPVIDTNPNSSTFGQVIGGTLVSSQTVTVKTDGTVPDSANTASLGAGSYAYEAGYSGDIVYASFTSDAEPLTVATSTSSVATTIYDAATNKPISNASQLPGISVYDTSTVTGDSGNPPAPTGTITYFFYTTMDGTGP